MNPDNLTALITGSTRGIGYHSAALLLQRGVRVYINGRDRQQTTTAARSLDESGMQALPLAFDATDADQCEAACAALSGGVDILVNNAGIFPDAATAALDIDEATLNRAWSLNFLAGWRLASLLMPGMRSRGFGRVVNLTSGYASLNKPGRNLLAYRASKAALNLLTTTLAAELDEQEDVKVRAVDPGWVRTDMGGEQAPRSPEEAAGDVVWTAMAADAASGVLFRYREPVNW